MMMNLFSVFDPTSFIFSLPLNWISSMLSIIIMPTIYWMIPSRLLYFWQFILVNLNKEFKIILMNNNFNKGATLLFINLFMIILFNNFLGLYPYIFTSSSHLTFTLTLSLPLWMSFMIYGWINNSTHMFCHLIPQGTPPLLMPFMVCIETISNIIRPGTLAIRLTANMIAGHLLMTLLGNTGIGITNFLIMILIITQMLLLSLEFAVAIIQSYVFAILASLYSSESN